MTPSCLRTLYADVVVGDVGYANVFKEKWWNKLKGCSSKYYLNVLPAQTSWIRQIETKLIKIILKLNLADAKQKGRTCSMSFHPNP